MGQTSRESGRAVEVTEQRSPRSAATFGELLQTVLEQTEAMSQLLQQPGALPEELSAFVAAARQLRQEQATPEVGIRTLVGLAMPIWLGELCTGAAGEAVTTAVARSVSEDPPSRRRVLSLLERLAER